MIEAPRGTYALRYAGMGEVRQLEQYYRLNRAENLPQFMDAMAMNALPSINYVYADQDGNIGFIHNVQYPNRDDAWDWSKDLPGDRSDLVWDGYRPFDDVPKLFNPQSGFVFNSNNRPFSATDGPDNLAPDDFPQSMGLQTNETNRSLRVIELTDGVTPVDRDALLALKFDTGYAADSDAAKVIAAVLADGWSDEPELAAAADHLRGWDRRMDASSRHAALGGLTVIKKVTENLTGIPAPEPEDAFRWAVTYLMDHHGRIDPEWGAVNRLVRGDVNVPVSGGSDVLRAIYPQDIRDDGQLRAGAGDTWIALVE
ncbi:MAG: penicillin acylase family protein [Proteobacteria bacterium]|nr:penicillin acylase family protein [Pseudomonadota bacterium]